MTGLVVWAAAGVLAAVAALFSMPAGAQASGQAAGSPTLDAVRARGVLLCGVDGHVAGFSLPDAKGVMRGLDADTCRAVAAAVLGEANLVRFVAVTTTTRFTALQSGEIDLLSRNTTWTLGREAGLGLLFAGVRFYDGTGFLVRVSAGVRSAKELDGATVCIEPETSTGFAVVDYFRRNGMRFSPVVMGDVSSVHEAFLAGRCDAYSSDLSQLAGFRHEQGARAGEFVLLPEAISKEPLGAMVRKGDDAWFDLVRWTHFAQVAAEELGVTGANADRMLASRDPAVRRLLGADDEEGGKGIGADPRWAYRVVKQVGNYGEMFERDIAPLGVPRGLNALWTQGGLLYAPPMR